jgi:hypothetical protein
MKEHKAMRAKPKDEQKKIVGRRDFLRAVGAGAVGIAASAPLTGEAQAATESPEEQRKARYKETDHIRRYYSVNRYPG